MIRVKMGAIIKDVPDATWYLVAGWKIIENKKVDNKKVEVIKDDKTDTEKKTSK
jgi:hypothetical protein